MTLISVLSSPPRGGGGAGGGGIIRLTARAKRRTGKWLPRSGGGFCLGIAALLMLVACGGTLTSSPLASPTSAPDLDATVTPAPAATFAATRPAATNAPGATPAPTATFALATIPIVASPRPIPTPPATPPPELVGLAMPIRYPTQAQVNTDVLITAGLNFRFRNSPAVTSALPTTAGQVVSAVASQPSQEVDVADFRQYRVTAQPRLKSASHDLLVSDASPREITAASLDALRATQTQRTYQWSLLLRPKETGVVQLLPSLHLAFAPLAPGTPARDPLDIDAHAPITIRVLASLALGGIPARVYAAVGGLLSAALPFAEHRASALFAGGLPLPWRPKPPRKTTPWARKRRGMGAAIVATPPVRGRLPEGARLALFIVAVVVGGGGALIGAVVALFGLFVAFSAFRLGLQIGGVGILILAVSLLIVLGGVAARGATRRAR